jgi:DNA-binding NarL/FixJ family response regulator
MSPDRLRVLIASPDLVLRCGLRCFVQDHCDGTVVAETRTERETLEVTIRLQPDVVLLIILDMVGGLGPQRIISTLSRVSRVIVISPWDAWPDDGLAAVCLTQGRYTATDLICALKGTARINASKKSYMPHAIIPVNGSARAGISADRLSTREVQVMDCIADAMSNSEIAQFLGLREKTIKNHINRIFSKLGVQTRAQAIVRWLAFNELVPGPREADSSSMATARTRSRAAP